MQTGSECTQAASQAGPGAPAETPGPGPTKLGCREAAQAARALRAHFTRTSEVPACMQTHQACKLGLGTRAASAAELGAPRAQRAQAE